MQRLVEVQKPLCSPLLKLPLELRQQIYSYILPYTTTQTYLPTSRVSLQPTILWHRRPFVPLLQTCPQIRDECLSILYGSNTFVINIRFDSVKFHFTWLTAKGLKPKILHDFPQKFAPHCVRRIRAYQVTVDHAGEYQGMIKFNCGGAMVTAGVKERVAQFVRAAHTEASLRRISVQLTYGNPVLRDIRGLKGQKDKIVRIDDSKLAVTQRVLEPLMQLTACSAEVLGAITEDYAALLEQALVSDDMQESSQALVETLPKTPNIEPAVLWRWKMNWNA